MAANNVGFVQFPDATSADGVANALAAAADTHPSLYNGTTWDRQRSGTDLILLASAARTTTTNGTDQTNYNWRGLHVVIDTTAVGVTPSTVYTIQGKDALSGQYYTILASAAVVSISTVVLRVYPGLTAAANLVANDVLPRTWRVIATHGNAFSATYSVSASLVV